LRHRLVVVVRPLDLVTRAGEQSHQELARARVVVDDEDVRGPDAFAADVGGLFALGRSP
jgi:hypothetical protein